MAATSSQNVSSFQCPITFDFDPTKNVVNLPASVVPTWVFLVAVNAVICPPTVLINLLIIWTVLENERLRSNSYHLVFAILSFSDLLVGLFLPPLSIVLIVGTLDQVSYLCELAMAYAVPTVICYGWSSVTLMIVSVERYLFIEHPFYYQASVTSKKLMMVTAAGWVLVGIPKLLGRFLANDSFWARQLPMILTLGPSFLVSLFCVTKIHLTARRQMRTIAAQQNALPQQRKIKEYKRVFTLGIIVLASVVFFCPILIFKIAGAVKGRWSDELSYLGQPIYFTSLHLQSLVNPIIYSFRLSDIRRGVAKKLCLV